MKRKALVALAIGSAGALWLYRRNQAATGRSHLLGPPVDADGTPTLTRHGQYGAPRAGPPPHRHQGIDLIAPAGSYVLAVGDGVIVHANPGLGKVVRKLRLDAPAAWSASGRLVDTIVYADLGQPFVRPGDRVRMGDPIALVAKAGFVHFVVKETRASGEVFFDPSEAGLAYRDSRPLIA